ncbi:hypothetical protein Tco_1199796 [Tanacetum coccineum]
MRPFGCLVTILNTIDHLGKFDGKADEGFFVGYSLNSKSFRVFYSKTRIVEENLHIRFSESTPNVVGSGPDWLFDIDALTRTMNYKPIVAGTQSNGFAGTKACELERRKNLSKIIFCYHYGLWYGYSLKRTKTKQNGRNLWKEYEKSNGNSTRNRGRSLIEGLGLEMGERLGRLEASLLPYIKSPSHTEKDHLG